MRGHPLRRQLRSPYIRGRALLFSLVTVHHDTDRPSFLFSLRSILPPMPFEYRRLPGDPRISLLECASLHARPVLVSSHPELGPTIHIQVPSYRFKLVHTVQLLTTPRREQNACDFPLDSPHLFGSRLRLPPRYVSCRSLFSLAVSRTTISPSSYIRCLPLQPPAPLTNLLLSPT